MPKYRPNTDKLELTQGMMCSGKKAHKQINDYYAARTQMCTNSCSIRRRSILLERKEDICQKPENNSNVGALLPKAIVPRTFADSEDPDLNVLNQPTWGTCI